MTMSVNDRLAAAEAVRRRIEPGEVHIKLGDARHLDIAAESIDLVVTSPPYFNLKSYAGGGKAQLGDNGEFQPFLDQMHKALRECYLVLKPGGRLCLNSGDICLSRKVHGHHSVLPLHAHYALRLQELGFHLLAPIIWHKIANARSEVSRPSGCLGRPYEPNGVVKNEVEWILVAKKPGPYRKVTDDVRLASMIDREDFARCMTQIWRLPGASTRRGHPAPFPNEIPRRLISMYSFVGDRVLDPFAGSGTTGVAARELGRNAILVDCSAAYIDLMRRSVKLSGD